MQNNKKMGARSRDRVRGSVGLGIGLGGSIGIRNWDRVRAGC